MKEALSAKLSEYLARENAWISQEDARLREEEQLQKKLIDREEKLSEARREHDRIGRELGRAEGAALATNVTVEQIVPAPHVRGFARELSESIAEAEREEDIGNLKNRLIQIRARIKAFIDGLSGAAPVTSAEVAQQVRSLGSALERVEKEESSLAGELEALRAQIAKTREQGFEAERDLVELEAAAREAQAKVGNVQAARASIAALRERFKEEVREGVALIGAIIADWEREQIPPGALSEDRAMQEKRRREVERLKTKIEESGVGNGDAVVREFTQTKERDEFLARELADLERSAGSLKDIIAELEKTIDEHFTAGL